MSTSREDEWHGRLKIYRVAFEAVLDIELVIPPAQVDKVAFIKAIDGIQPRGMTPLSAAVQFAAEALAYTTRKANIILVSDGLETCGKDPCSTASELRRRAADLTEIIETTAEKLILLQLLGIEPPTLPEEVIDELSQYRDLMA